MRIRTINSAALAIGSVTGAAVFLAFLCFEPGWTALGAGAGVFFLVYGLGGLFIRKYVIQRIKPLYQIVQGESVRTRTLEKALRHKDVIGTMEDELKVWAHTQASEIVRLKEMERYRKEFLGNVSHELKTPLFTLQGYILTLLDGGLEDSRINVRYLQRSEKSVDRLIAIVKDLEQISSLESGALKLDLRTFDIVGLAREVADSLQTRAAEAKIVLKVQAELPVEVTADRERIGRVLYNLIYNSIKYGIENGTTTIRFVDMFEKVMIEVEDNGVGIATQDLPRVFERFYRTDKSRSRDQGGTGLGLAIVKHIVEAHGETVTARSKPGAGSTFSFILKKAR